ncbi:hypothetical protein RCL1_001588 [Eukaryota sp. TZLM3-RCL]
MNYEDDCFSDSSVPESPSPGPLPPLLPENQLPKHTKHTNKRRFSVSFNDSVFMIGVEGDITIRTLVDLDDELFFFDPVITNHQPEFHPKPSPKPLPLSLRTFPSLPSPAESDLSVVYEGTSPSCSPSDVQPTHRRTTHTTSPLGTPREIRDLRSDFGDFNPLTIEKSLCVSVEESNTSRLPSKSQQISEPLPPPVVVEPVQKVAIKPEPTPTKSVSRKWQVHEPPEPVTKSKKIPQNSQLTKPTTSFSNKSNNLTKGWGVTRQSNMSGQQKSRSNKTTNFALSSASILESLRSRTR